MATETARGGSTIPPDGGPVRASKRGRRRRAGVVRRFLPQSGSTAERPELGQEGASESAALVEALRSRQVFDSVIVRRAVLEMNGTEAKIVKQPFSSG